MFFTYDIYDTWPIIPENILLIRIHTIASEKKMLKKPDKAHRDSWEILQYLILFCMLSYIVLVSFGYNKISFVICPYI